MTGKIKVMSILGTRPEAIKMAPVVRELMRHTDTIETRTLVTAQHREMLDQVHDFFGIVPDDDLDIHSPGQTLTQITNRCLQGVGQAIEAHRPDAVVAQGDNQPGPDGTMPPGAGHPPPRHPPQRRSR